MNLGIVGAGTMGAGIAQVAALMPQSTVILYDTSQAILDKALERIQQSVQKAITLKKLPDGALRQIQTQLKCTTEFENLKTCDLIIEAIPEDMQFKQALFKKLDALCKPDTCFVSNTSSLSIKEMAEVISRPSQVAGMHFFNPVPQMKLVEIISTEKTSPQLAETLFELAKAMGKTPVHAKDTPGFIVNRVARPFYLEALRMLGEGLADVKTIDTAMKEVGGFKMGPFELMDLIGIDVNYAVTQSVYQAFNKTPRFKPHPIQAQLVIEGHLGQKSGQGFYNYSVNPPQPVDLKLPEISSGQSLLTPQEIVLRIYTMLANEAIFAVEEKVATPDDIDTAMKLGTNYPLGPLEWAHKVGAGLKPARLQ